jgi:hypothetical protein
MMSEAVHLRIVPTEDPYAPAARTVCGRIVNSPEGELPWTAAKAAATCPDCIAGREARICCSECAGRGKVEMLEDDDGRGMIIGMAGGAAGYLAYELTRPTVSMHCSFCAGRGRVSPKAAEQLEAERRALHRRILKDIARFVGGCLALLALIAAATIIASRLLG